MVLNGTYARLVVLTREWGVYQEKDEIYAAYPQVTSHAASLIQCDHVIHRSSVNSRYSCSKNSMGNAVGSISSSLPSSRSHTDIMMKSANGTKLFFVQSSPPRPTPSMPGARRRLCFMSTLLSFFTFASLLSHLPYYYSSSSSSTATATAATTTTTPPPNLSPASASTSHHPPLPAPIFDTLLFYATSSSAAGRMADPELRAAAAVLHRRAPCNLLVFGLGHESPLWLALNHGGHTVFVDHSDLLASRFEEERPGYLGLEVYATAFPTRVADLRPLLAAARDEEASPSGHCRPVQDLLFSDCPLALSDLPYHLYRLAWDVILVDGPPGYHPEAPGRAAAIFTAAVLARSVGGEGTTEVLVHDHDREVERVCSEEFLCAENMEEGSAGQLAHFVIHRGRDNGGGGGFCRNRTATT